MDDMPDPIPNNLPIQYETGGPTFRIPADVQAALDRALTVPLSSVVAELEALIREAAIYSHPKGPALPTHVALPDVLVNTPEGVFIDARVDD